jgi:predicted DCC family thiol-disulfide oxidoreductase YuxK
LATKIAFVCWAWVDLQNKRVIFYDGLCVLCSSLIRFIIRKDKKEEFWYSSLQSQMATDLLKTQLRLSELPDSIVYLRGGKVYYYSDAVIQIFRDLGGWFRMMIIFSLVPAFLRNMIYKWIARIRYRIFGKRDRCFVPDEKTRSRVLE